MGIFDSFLKARKRPPTEMDAEYTAASIRVGEEFAASSQNAINQVDFNRVGRAMTGSIWNASSIIATECASHPLKLYRRANSGKRVGKCVKIDKRQSDFLTGRSSSCKVTAKQASMADSAGTIEEVIEHPALDLLSDPDPVTTASDFLTMLYWYREVAGKAYVWTGEQTKDGPSGLYILHPQFTQPVLSRQDFISAYRYGRDITGVIEIPAEQVIFSPYQRDPFRPWDGISWLTSVEQYADAENAALIAEVQRWKNSGQAGFILKVPMTYTDQQMKQVEAALRAKAGPLAAGRALIIREAEIVQSASKAHEMGYIEGLTQAEKAIYRAAGIPEAIWKLNDANLAGAKMGERLLMRSCFKRMRRVAEDMTAYLLPMFGEEDGTMWFGYENPDLEDQVAEASMMNAAFIAGVVSEDEYRKVLYLPPRNGSDSVDIDEEEMTVAQADDAEASDDSESELDDVEESNDEMTDDTVTEAPAETTSVDASATDTVQAAASDINVASTALNGAQVQALLELATAVSSNQLPSESARAIAAAAFPTVAPEVLDAVFKPLSSFTPASAPQQSDSFKSIRGLVHRSKDGDDTPVAAVEQSKAEEGFVPPEQVRRNAERALEWRREYNRGMTPVGVARARDLMNGRALSADTISRMVSYFARHEVDKQAEGFNDGEDGFPSAGRIAWDGWGGDEGKAWAERIAARFDDEEKMCDDQEKMCGSPEHEEGKMKPPSELTEEELRQLAEFLKPLLMPKSVRVDRYDWDGQCGCALDGIHGKAKQEETDDKIEEEIRRAIEEWAKRTIPEVIRQLDKTETVQFTDLSRTQLQEVLAVGVEAAFKAGAQDTLSSFNSTLPPLSSEQAAKYIQQYNFNLVSGVTRTMRDQLQTQISSGIEAGATRNEIAEKLLENVDDMSRNRATVIAQTETARAYQHGALQQGIEMGIPAKKWRLSGNPCGLCEAAARKSRSEPVPIGEPFLRAGETIMGTDGKLYTMKMDVMVASEAHPNCACGTTKVDEEV